MEKGGIGGRHSISIIKTVFALFILLENGQFICAMNAIFVDFFMKTQHDCLPFCRFGEKEVVNLELSDFVAVIPISFSLISTTIFISETLSKMDEEGVYIVSAVRTPVGQFNWSYCREK